MPDGGRLHSKPETLAAMLFTQNALPDYCLNDAPDNPSKHPSKEIPQ
jgi:hypothetical protein